MFGSNSGWLFTDAAESLFVVNIIIDLLCIAVSKYLLLSYCRLNQRSQ